MVKLTLCAIAKNEETSLPGMVESVRDIVDEVIICDTGSDDGTIAVAESLGCKVVRHPRSDEWKADPKTFHFSEARNLSLEHCTGDFLLILDCDERMEPESARILKAELERLPENIDLALLTMVMCHDDWTPYQNFLAERIIRNGRGVKFESGMHNFATAAEERRIGLPHIRVLHNRGVKPEADRNLRAKQRVDMAEYDFLAKIKANPNDRRSLFYLAGTYYDAGRIDEAIEWYEKYLPVSDWPQERYQAAILLADAYRKKNQPEKARKVLSDALADNWRRAEAYVALGEDAINRGDLEQAEWWFKAASLKPMPVDPLFVEPAAHTWQPHKGLWEVYRRMGRTEEAMRHGMAALEMGAKGAYDVIKYEKNHAVYSSGKILVLVDRGQTDFVSPIIEHWKAQGKEVTVWSEWPEVEPVLSDFDLVWCEWAGDMAAKLTSLPKHGRIIVRVIGYEVWNGLINQVNWAHVDDVIFISNSLKAKALARCPIIAELCNCVVVPCGADTKKFTIAEGKAGNKIAMACYLNPRKNLPMALQIMAALPKPFELHIVGEWQDAELAEYVCRMTCEMGLAGRVFITDKRVDDLNEWFADKDFYLSASIRETFHYTLAEGMAAGLKPIIHDWESAEEFYPREYIFRTIEEAAAMIQGEIKPLDYRWWVIDEIDQERMLRRIDRVITKPSVGAVGEPKYPYASEYKLIRALEELGCVTDGETPECMFVMGPNQDRLILDNQTKAAKRIHWTEDQNLYSWLGTLKREPVDEAERERAQAGEAIHSKAIEGAVLLCCQTEWWVDELKGRTDAIVKHLPLIGAEYPFRRLPGVEQDIDVGIYGHGTPHRNAKLEKLGETFGICALQGCYDHEQANLFFNKCKIALNLHAYPEPTVERRISEAMSAGACVVSERLPEGHPFPADCFVETDDVEAAISELLDNDAKRKEIADRGYRWIWSRLRLERQVEKALDLLGI